MSIRQTIISNLDEALRAIKKTNGYNTDAGENVLAYWSSGIPQKWLPAIVYRDYLSQCIDGAIGLFRWRLNIEFALCVSANKTDSPTQLRALIDDVIKAIGQGAQTRWGGNSVNTYILQSEADIEIHDKSNGMALLTVCIEYDALRWRT